jgi:hemerythrin-like domain-containing protein
MGHKKPFTAQHVEIQHNYINSCLDILKNDIVKEVAPEDFSEWKLAYIWQLRDLRNTLTKHFDYEEESGFIKEIIDEVEEERSQAIQLKNEHDSLVGILDAIVYDVKAMPKFDEIRLEEIRDRLSDFIETVHAHENTENELIQQLDKNKHN